MNSTTLLASVRAATRVACAARSYATGRVTYFNASKGFGFIEEDGASGAAAEQGAEMTSSSEAPAHQQQEGNAEGAKYGAKTSYFVHQSSIQMAGFRFLEAGEKVDFDKMTSERGHFAVNVKPLGEKKARPSHESRRATGPSRPRRQRSDSRRGDGGFGESRHSRWSEGQTSASSE